MVTLQIDSRVLLSRPRLFVPFFGERVADERRTPRGFVSGESNVGEAHHGSRILFTTFAETLFGIQPVMYQLSTGYFNARSKPAYTKCRQFF